VKKKDDSIIIESIKKNIKSVILPTHQAIRVVENNIPSLISELGEFHWRGLAHPDKESIGSFGEFHANEQGDATLQTGVLLVGLAWKNKNLPSRNNLENIKKILKYFQLHQENNFGGLGRSFVLDEFYQKLPESEQNGKGRVKSSSPINYMRYRKININNKSYWQRYDISVDDITHAIAGLYWVYKLVPEYSEVAKEILNRQYDFLERHKWKLLDDDGYPMMFGNHSPSSNNLSRVNKIILEYVYNGKIIFDAKDDLFLSSVPSYIKDTKTEYSKCFADIQQILIMHNMSIPIKKRAEILKKELSDNNLFFNAVYNKVCNGDLPVAKNQPTWVLNTGHPSGILYGRGSVPMHLRRGYCRWEFAPNHSCLGKTGTELTGNSDLLLAYYIGEK